MEKVKVKFLKSPTGVGYAYNQGDVAELTDAQFKDLKELGYVEIYKDETVLPEDLPGRESFIKLEMKLEDIKKLDKTGLIDLEGIGDKTAEKVIEYFKK